FVKVGMQLELQETLAHLDRCRIYRNLLTHCIWWQSKHRGLFFVSLEDHAKEPGLLKYRSRYASQRALEEIEMYCWCTFTHLDYLMEFFAVKAGLYRSHVPPKPPKLTPLTEHKILLPYKEPH